ncbi:MAG: ABC transporter permease [Deltaproteobacteria bacterium HGW-Deltaproteobacteria-20]|nr:MAG: ABC transporter permease [Deltaproteobacteria bacterium HGW-Deltaproteobacteria-20]
MLKPSPRRNIILGILLLLVAVGVAIFDYVQPAVDGAGFFRRYLLVFDLGVLLLGVAAFVRGVWVFAAGQQWRPSDSEARVGPWVKRNSRTLLLSGTVLMGTAFGVLTAIAVRLPKPRGTQFVIHHELLRMAALLSSVLFLLGVLALLLPMVLNVLEGRSFVSFVGARHVRAAKSGFLTVISVLSISGVAVSSCALVSVSSIMGGFGADLQRKILGNNPHITIDVQDQGGFDEWEPVLQRVRLVPGVAAATPVIAGEAMGSSHTNTSGTMVRGVDPESIGNVIDLLQNIEVGKFEYLTDPEQLTRLPAGEIVGLGPGGEPFRKGPDFGGSFFRGSGTPIDPSVKDVLRAPAIHPGVIMGRELAKTLHVYVGDEVTLISPMGDLGPMGVMPRVRKFRVAAIFYSGMYEYDASHAYVLIDVAQDLFSMGSNVSSIDVRAANGERASDLRPAVHEVVQREDLRVRDWKELNRNLFSALKLERIATFIILSLAIAVASFCIICTLLLMVTEKGKEIAVLKSLGASSRSIMQVFMLEGVVIGAIGTIFGVVTGIALTVGLSLYGLRLDPEVYYIDRLPIKVDWVDWVLVALSALAICTLATIYPAHAASRLRPVESLRHE